MNLLAYVSHILRIKCLGHMKRALNTRGHTLPIVSSDNWRVQPFDRLTDPSLNERAIPEVAVEFGEI